ncbi:MAG: hypothetical protein MMC33_007356 [Icmadophila ericetorum]|nr:hypothetical protein [Icmadophila ericetorum]
MASIIKIITKTFAALGLSSSSPSEERMDPDDLTPSTPATSFSESSIHTCEAKCTSWGPHGVSKHQDEEEYVQHALLLPADEQCMFTSEDLGLCRVTTSEAIVPVIPPTYNLRKLLLPKPSSSAGQCLCPENYACKCGPRADSRVFDIIGETQERPVLPQAGDGVAFSGYRATTHLGSCDDLYNLNLQIPPKPVYGKSFGGFPTRDEEMMGAGVYRISKEASRGFIINNAIKQMDVCPDLFVKLAAKNVKLPGYNDLTYNEVLRIRYERIFSRDPNMYRQAVDEYGVSQQFGFPVDPHRLCPDDTSRHLRSATWDLVDPTARNFNMTHCHYASGLCVHDASTTSRVKSRAENDRAQQPQNNQQPRHGQPGIEQARPEQQRPEQLRPEKPESEPQMQHQRRQRKYASPLRQEVRPEGITLPGPAPQVGTAGDTSVQGVLSQPREVLHFLPKVESGPDDLGQEICTFPPLSKAVHSKMKVHGQRRVEFASPLQRVMGLEQAITSSPSPTAFNCSESTDVIKSPPQPIPASIKPKPVWQPPPPQGDLRTLRSSSGKIVPSLASGDHPLVQRQREITRPPTDLEAEYEPAQDYARDAANLTAQSIREKQSLTPKFEFVFIPRFEPRARHPSNSAFTFPSPDCRLDEDGPTPPSGSDNGITTPNEQSHLSLYKLAEEAMVKVYPNDEANWRPMFADNLPYIFDELTQTSHQMVDTQLRHMKAEPGYQPFSPSGDKSDRKTEDTVSQALANQIKTPAHRRRPSTLRPLAPSTFEDDEQGSDRVNFCTEIGDEDGDISAQKTVKSSVNKPSRVIRRPSTPYTPSISLYKGLGNQLEGADSDAETENTSRQANAKVSAKTRHQAPQDSRRRSTTVIHRPAMHRRTSSQNKVKVILQV